MKRPVWGKVVIVALLLIAIAAVAQMKPRSGTDPVTDTGAARPATAASGNGLPLLLDLGSTSCIPCKMMAPVLEDLKKTYASKLRVEFVDVWEDREAGKRYGIEAIPTQIFYDASGKELYRHTGYYSKEDIVAKLGELGLLKAQAP